MPLVNEMFHKLVGFVLQLIFCNGNIMHVIDCERFIRRMMKGLQNNKNKKIKVVFPLWLSIKK